MQIHYLVDAGAKVEVAVVKWCVGSRNSMCAPTEGHCTLISMRARLCQTSSADKPQRAPRNRVHSQLSILELSDCGSLGERISPTRSFRRTFTMSPRRSKTLACLSRMRKHAADMQGADARFGICNPCHAQGFQPINCCTDGASTTKWCAFFACRDMTGAAETAPCLLIT